MSEMAQVNDAFYWFQVTETKRGRPRPGGRPQSLRAVRNPSETHREAEPMVTPLRETTGSERPDVLGVRPLSRNTMLFAGLGTVQAADLAGLIPAGPAAGTVLTLAVITVILKDCVYRKR
ncbi:hypothetical protein ACF052_33115 [Streptomyces pilosus]|uniref:hypothetical protein n=1 Tax=Streptomyces pilosus TaxID=28893 RepID=UPI0037013CBB